MSGSNYQANAHDAYFANPFYTAGQMAPVYPYLMHNEDGSVATDGTGNSYDISNYDYWVVVILFMRFRMISAVRNVMPYQVRYMVRFLS